MTSSGMTVVDAVARVAVVEPELRGFSWFGIRRALVPTGVDDSVVWSRGALATVTNCLYANAYCRGGPHPYVEREQVEHHGAHDGFTRSLLGANSTTTAWSELRVERADRDGVVGLLGPLRVHAANGGLVRRVDRDIPLADPAPARVSFGGVSASLRASPGFALFIGERDLEPGARRGRVYWNLTPTFAPVFVRVATQAMNRAGVGLRLKVVASPRLYVHRVDVAVLYLDPTNPHVDDTLAEIHAACANGLRPAIPLFTDRLASGVSRADDPETGASFGMHLCEIVASGLVSAARAGSVTHADRVDAIGAAFADAGMDPEQPWRRRGSTPLPAWSVDRAAPTARLRRGHSVPPPADDRAVVERIARELCDVVVVDGDRGQWIGAETMVAADGSRAVFHRTLSSSIYGGTGGVSLFLARFAALTGDEQARQVALAGARQALVQPAEGSGLYVGLLGVALAARAVARLHSDEALVARAEARLAEAVAAEPAVSSDLLHGVAGQVVGLLAAGRDDATARAVELGDELRARAVPEHRGCSWPSPGIPARRPLTGLSHGAAGMAFALLELWHVTGDERHLGLALDAVAHEDSTFSRRRRNWPDHRALDASAAGPSFPMFWCHGAPGIVLQRIRQATLTGTAPSEAVEIAVAGLADELERQARTPGANQCICHGVVGMAEVLATVAASDVLSAPLRARAEAVSRSSWNILVSWYGRSEWPLGAIAGNPSLLLGSAGIGYAAMRRLDPDVPSVLLIDPTTTFGPADTAG